MRLVEHIIARHGAAVAPTQVNVGAESLRPNLLGMAVNATEVDINAASGKLQAMVVRKPRLRLEIAAVIFNLLDIAQLPIRNEDQASQRCGHGGQHPKGEEPFMIHREY